MVKKKLRNRRVNKVRAKKKIGCIDYLQIDSHIHQINNKMTADDIRKSQ